jgi:hypothetical protein
MDDRAQETSCSRPAAKAVFPVAPLGVEKPNCVPIRARRNARPARRGRQFRPAAISVELAQQIIDLGDRGRNVPNDQRVRTNIGKDVSASVRNFLIVATMVVAWA